MQKVNVSELNCFKKENCLFDCCLGRKGGKGPKELVPIRDKIAAGQNVNDPNHWSHEEKYDADTYLEINYKKHLARHANRFVLRIFVFFYIF